MAGRGHLHQGLPCVTLDFGYCRMLMPLKNYSDLASLQDSSNVPGKQASQFGQDTGINPGVLSFVRRGLLEKAIVFPVL